MANSEGPSTAAEWSAALDDLATNPRPAAAERIVALAQRAHRPEAAWAPLEEAIAAANDNDLRLIASGLARRTGETERALAYLRAGNQADPRDGRIYNELGLVYLDRDDRSSARRWLLAGTEAAPGMAALHYNLGRTLDDLIDGEDPMPHYEQAVALAPDELQFWRALIRSYELRNALQQAWQALDRAERALGRVPNLLLLRANLALRNDAVTDAWNQLVRMPRDGLDLSTRRDASFVAGELCHRLGDVDSAVAHFAQGNAYSAQTPAGRQADKNRFLGLLDRLERAFTAPRVAGWRRPSRCDAPPPVFLMGFPRSGSTLIATALDQHPAVTVLHERGCASAIPQGLEQLPGGYPEALFQLADSRWDELRKLYRQARAQVAGRHPQPTIVDKLPLNLVHVGALQAIFPEAKFIFCLRHPADVVLSCFMQPLDPNDAMANFQRLDDATHAYDRVMTLWEQYRRALPLNLATVPYEALVEDFPGSMAHVLTFLDLPWADAVVHRYQAPGSGGQVRTPSYHQVSQNLYGHARYRWRQYRNVLAPHLPTLQAWAAHYGYRDDGAGPESWPQVAVSAPAAA